MGVGAAALMPCTLSILTNVFSTDRGRAIGIWSATAGLGVAIGPILGGFLLVHYWWGSVFLINVPIAVMGALAAIFLVPNSRNVQAKKPDPVGVLLSILGFGLLLWAIIEAPGRTWGAPPIVGALAGSVALIAGFIVWEHRRTDPMLPVSFFRRRRYSAAIASLALVLFALLGLLFLMTQYLQFVLGFSAFRAGLAIGPVALVLLVTAPFSAVLARKILIGAGVGLALAPSIDSVMGSVPKEEAGVGSATSDTSMQGRRGTRRGRARNGVEPPIPAPHAGADRAPRRAVGHPRRHPRVAGRGAPGGRTYPRLRRCRAGRRRPAIVRGQKRPLSFKPRNRRMKRLSITRSASSSGGSAGRPPVRQWPSLA